MPRELSVRRIALAIVIAALLPPSLHAQTYPAKLVRVVVPTSPGGLMDFTLRLVAPKMTELTGQSVIVENRPGAANNLGYELVARAPGDGYTLVAATLTLVVNPSIYEKLPFSVERDLAPVSQLVAAPYVLVVHPSVPARSVKELIALARAKPDSLNYSTGGSGTNFHMAGELFKQQTRTRMVHVPYKGGGPALAAVIAGETGLTFPSIGPALPQINAGRVRALATTGTRRAPLLPTLPTVIEAGVPDYTFTSWVGLLAPGTTPPATVAAINAFVVKAMRSSDVVQKLAGDGTEVVAGSPEDFRGLMKTELARWSVVIKAAGLKVE